MGCICNGYSTTITITPVNVFDLPEYAFGSLLALTAFIAALAGYTKLKKIPMRNIMHFKSRPNGKGT
jgi:hypothetical protein